MSADQRIDMPHESGVQHVTGEAVYVDDMPAGSRLLVGKVVYSPYASARIRSFDLTAARLVTGIHAVLSFREIPGTNQMGPVVHDEPCLADSEVRCVGQAMFLIAAEREEQYREAERLIRVEYEPLDPILDIETAMRLGSLMGPPRLISRGNADEALRTAPHVIEGILETGAQEHWYLESQVCLCVPGEDGEMMVYSSSQNPSETQAVVAEVLGIGKNRVTVEVRRIGGAFGGKETQANHTACWTALLAHATKRPVRIRLFRDDDMIMTGKRHRFLTRYSAGFDNDGTLLGVKFDLNSDGGIAADLSFAIMERAMLHVDNAYYIPNLSVSGRVWKTNLPSNTAFRGFGGPQGMAAIETVIDRIARHLGKDAASIRRRNLYGINDRNTTHYGETIEENRLPVIYDRLFVSSEYEHRRKEIESFNASNEFLKKGMAMTPVKFGISFTTSFLNQGGALVNIYKDGTILINHGGTEMGQGLHTKIRQIAAAEFSVDLDRVRITPTNTSKVPNTPATAASSGTDLNGMAVRNAIETLKERIAEGVARIFTQRAPDEPTSAQSIFFVDNTIVDRDHPERILSFEEAMQAMVTLQISLSATGFYRTPNISWDKAKGEGKPFYYYAFGMAVTEVLLDILTGHHTILRTDILHDAGDSINPAIDLGQIEGGFIQGVGWCTTEEIKWDNRGHLLTHSPDTYKIPTIADIPRDFRTTLLEGFPNPLAIRKSKAVAEPPFMLALSAWLAIKDAISAVAGHSAEPQFSIPATNETILLSIEKLHQHSAGGAARANSGERLKR